MQSLAVPLSCTIHPVCMSALIFLTAEDLCIFRFTMCFCDAVEVAAFADFDECAHWRRKYVNFY